MPKTEKVKFGDLLVASTLYEKWQIKIVFFRYVNNSRTVECYRDVSKTSWNGNRTADVRSGTKLDGNIRAPYKQFDTIVGPAIRIDFVGKDRNMKYGKMSIIG